MDKRTIDHRINLLAVVMSSLLVILFLTALADSVIHQAEHMKNVTQANSERLVKAQTDVSNLRLQLEKQRDVITASRGIGLLDIEPGKWQTFVATFYAGSGGNDGGHITYSGKPVVNGWSIAADKSVIPMGSVIEIRFPDGTEQIGQVLDVGSAIKGHRLDIYCADKQECMRRGVQRVEVRILLKVVSERVGSLTNHN